MPTLTIGDAAARRFLLNEISQVEADIAGYRNRTGRDPDGLVETYQELKARLEGADRAVAATAGEAGDEEAPPEERPARSGWRKPPSRRTRRIAGGAG